MRHGKSNFTILKSKSFHRSRRWALAILAARTSHPRRESRDPRLEFSQSHHSPASLRALVSALAVGHWQWHPRAPLGHRTLRRTLRRSRWLAAGGTTPVYQVTLPRPLRLAPCAHIPAPALGLAQMASESLGPRFLPCCPGSRHSPSAAPLAAPTGTNQYMRTGCRSSGKPVWTSERTSLRPASLKRWRM